jgi:hypothetical protein
MGVSERRGKKKLPSNRMSKAAFFIVASGMPASPNE